MRHRKKKKTLDRKAAPRNALIRNLAVQFIIYETLTTTEAKAKVLRPYVEKLITKGKRSIEKKQKLAGARDMARFLGLEASVRKIFEVLSPRYAQRAGGYTRILKLHPRVGDAARMARIEFV